MNNEFSRSLKVNVVPPAPSNVEIRQCTKDDYDDILEQLPFDLIFYNEGFFGIDSQYSESDEALKAALKILAHGKIDDENFLCLKVMSFNNEKQDRYIVITDKKVCRITSEKETEDVMEYLEKGRGCDETPLDVTEFDYRQEFTFKRNPFKVILSYLGGDDSLDPKVRVPVYTESVDIQSEILRIDENFSVEAIVKDHKKDKPFIVKKTLEYYWPFKFPEPKDYNRYSIKYFYRTKEDYIQKKPFKIEGESILEGEGKREKIINFHDINLDEEELKQKLEEIKMDLFHNEMDVELSERFFGAVKDELIIPPEIKPIWNFVRTLEYER